MEFPICTALGQWLRYPRALFRQYSVGCEYDPCTLKSIVFSIGGPNHIGIIQNDASKLNEKGGQNLSVLSIIAGYKPAFLTEADPFFRQAVS